MNNNRLSTLNKLRVDRALLFSRVDQLLQGPSNYEEREGKIWVISENKFLSKRGSAFAVEILDAKTELSIKTFDTLRACGEFIGKSLYMVRKELVRGEPISWGTSLHQAY